MARGVLVRPLSRYYAGRETRRGLLLGYACVPEERIQPAFDSLLKCIPIAYLPTPSAYGMLAARTSRISGRITQARRVQVARRG